MSTQLQIIDDLLQFLDDNIHHMSEIDEDTFELAKRFYCQLQAVYFRLSETCQVKPAIQEEEPDLYPQPEPDPRITIPRQLSLI